MSSDKNNTNKQKETDKEKLAKESEAIVHKLDVFEEDDLFEEFEEGIF